MAQLATPDYVALGIFISYFTIILFLFDLVLGDLKNAYYAKISAPGKTDTRWTRKACLFVVLAVASFGHTWYYMFQYMAWSFANYHRLNPGLTGPTIERVASWLRNTSLFEEAWAAVCKKALNWWWSEQLCLFTAGAWSIFLAVQAKEYKIPRVWAYMVLGQLVAISVASNLFYAAVLLAPSKSRRNTSWKAGPMLFVPVLVSLGTVYLSPSTNDQTFLPNLLTMHALLVVPLLSPHSVYAQNDAASLQSPFAFSLSVLYRIVYAVASGLHLSTIINALRSLQSQGKEIALSQASLALVQNAWKTLHAHPAQSSIGWDVVWTTVGFIAWTAVECDAFGVAYLVFTTPFASIGGSAPFILRRVEDSSDDSSRDTKDE